jgi:hypothetical protein
MPEYAGRQAATTPINYGDLTGGLIDILKETEKKRNDEKARLDQIYQSADTDVRETEQFSNQNLQTLVHNAADKVRDQMYDWNQELKAGRLKPKEYQARIMQVQTGWSLFANNSKTFDDTMKNFLARQQPGEEGFIPGSGFEQFMSGVYAGNADLNNTELTSDYDSGKIFMSKRNADGEITSTFDVSRMGNPGNMIDNRFNLSANIDADVKTWEPWKKEEGSGRQGFTTIEDVRKNPAYNLMVDAKKKSILETDRLTASVLADNGAGFDYYDDPKKKDLAMLEAAEQAQRVAQASGRNLTEAELEEAAQNKGDRMILVEYDKTGTMQPIITDAQRKVAGDIIENQIEMKLGYSEAKTAAWRQDTSGGGDSGAGAGADQGSYATYAAFKRAWKGKTKIKAEASMNAMNPNYDFKQTSPGVWNISEPKVVMYQGEPVLDAKGKPKYVWNPVATGITNPKDMAPYIFKTGTKKGDTPYERYLEEKEAYGARHPGSRANIQDDGYKGDVIIQNGYEYKWNPKTKQYE